jgi:hypothetical protein
MRVTRSKRWVKRHQVRFEGLSETSADATELQFSCPRTGRTRRLSECTSCPSFVNIRPAPERGQVAMRCLCTDEDPLVRSVETQTQWPVIGPEVSIVAARRLAWATDCPMMLVAEADRFLGVVYAHELSESREPVSACLHEYPWALSARSTLGDAVEAFATLGLPALLLIAPDSELLGVVSRRHLARLGVPAECL